MLFQSLLRTLRTVLTHRRAEGKPARAPRRQPATGFRPRLEVLEDRTAPAVLTVNSTADTANITDTYLSLREAIAIVNNSPALNTLSSQIQGQISGPLHGTTSDTIQFNVTGPIMFGNSLATYVPTDGLVLSLPSTIAKITIDGGSTGVTLSGNSGRNFLATGGILQVAGGVQAQLINLTLTNGDLDGGGAIYNGGSLTLSGCTLSGNYAGERGTMIDRGGGGAIFNGGTLTIEKNSLLANNHASFGDGGTSANGGAITNFGSLTIKNSTLSGNDAGKDLAHANWPGEVGHGGAIYNRGGTVTITNSTLSGNLATGNGAAIAIIGGSLTMSNCTLNSNTAYQYGGAMYVDPAVATIVGCTFSDNSAPSGADLYNLDSAVTIIISSIANVTSGGGTVTDPIADLFAQVAALNLSSGQANSLTSKLQAAQQSLANANTTAAVNQLNAFINQLSALAHSHRLGEIDADELTDGVEALLSLIDIS